MSERNLGVGVMLHILEGGSKHSSQEYHGRTIKDAWIDDNRLSIEFKDGTTIQVYDQGQSCCESRYMTTDDDVKDLIGTKLKGIMIKDAPSQETDYGDHEVQFLEIQTNKNSVTFSNHNEHNGYYGGFGLGIIEI